MQRKRCSDDMFLEAVYSSNTYLEISQKTGQKLSTTIARYARVKRSLLERDGHLPKMQRKKIAKSNNLDKMVDKARLLQNHYQS